MHLDRKVVSETDTGELRAPSVVPAPEIGMALRIGTGESTAHHGELFQGQIEDRNSRRRRCLVTLPCPRLCAKAVFHPQRNCGIQVFPAQKEKARRVLELALPILGTPDVGGVLSIESNIVEGKGYGSSTADCVAAARAAANAFGVLMSEEEIARLVVEAEAASDNVMFSRAVLFAQREGVVLEDYRAALPPFEVLGIDSDKNGFVDTLEYSPARYSWREIQHFHTLVAALRRAIATSDSQLLGMVATASAEINERYLPKTHFADIRRLATAAGAAGVAAAHSGTLLSVLFNPYDLDMKAKIEYMREELCQLGITDCFHFQTWRTQQRAVHHE